MALFKEIEKPMILQQNYQKNTSGYFLLFMCNLRISSLKYSLASKEVKSL